MRSGAEHVQWTRGGADAAHLSYGSDPSQHAQLALAATDAPAPVCVVIHGGFWRARYGLDLGAPLANDLAAHGIAALNVEYRRVGAGGGWPQSGADVAAALDALAEAPPEVANRLDLTRVVALGHSAGGHLAGWLAGWQAGGRPGSLAPQRIRLTGFVAQAGVLDLEAAIAADLGAGAVTDFLGTAASPAALAQASPIRLLPTPVRSILVHGDRDQDVPLEQSRAYAAAARAAGDDALLIELPGADHYGVITPGTHDWSVCRAAVESLVR